MLTDRCSGQPIIIQILYSGLKRALIIQVVKNKTQDTVF